MPTELRDMRIDKVSLVDRGANGRTFAVLKRDAPPMPDLPPDERAGLLATIAKALGIPGSHAEPVSKANQTFASIVAGQQITEALDDSFWTLKDALWSAIYARDDNDQLLSSEARQGLIAQSLDEFRDYLLARMDEGVTKADEPAPDPLAGGLEAAIRKVGKKISAARLERLKAAADALTAVLAEVTTADEESDIEKEAEMPLSKEDIAQIVKAVQEADAPDPVEAAVAKAIEPLQAEIAALKKGETAGADAGADDAGEADEGEGISLEALSKDDRIPDAITKILVGVMTPVLDRLEKVEKAASRGHQTSADGQDESKVKKAASGWRARM